MSFSLNDLYKIVSNMHDFFHAIDFFICPTALLLSCVCCGVGSFAGLSLAHQDVIVGEILPEAAGRGSYTKQACSKTA